MSAPSIVFALPVNPLRTLFMRLGSCVAINSIHTERELTLVQSKMVNIQCLFASAFCSFLLSRFFI